MRNTIYTLTFLLFAGQLVAQDLDDLIIPRKSEIFIALQRSINSKTASPGDKFSAVVEVPVTQNDKIVIPVGSFIIGHVVKKKEAGRLKGKGKLMLGFDTIILPDGTTRKMRAAVQSAEGYETDTEESGEIESEGNQTEEVLVGAAKGGITGAITGATIGVFRRSTARSMGIGSVVGAAGGSLLALLDRGEDVELPKGASLTIQLQEDVQFVKPSEIKSHRTLPTP